MFTSIVVALDLGTTGDRSLPTAASVAALGRLPVELLTVSSPGLPAGVDLYELERRAKALGLARFSCLVLHDDDAGAAIVEHMTSRPDALLVMGTSARGPLAGQLLGSVSEDVLGRIESPVLVVGPRSLSQPLAVPTLVACVGASDGGEASAPAIASWLGTFGGTTLLTTVAPAADAAGATEHLHALAGRLDAAAGAAPAVALLCGNDVVASLQAFAEGIADPVFLAVSTRWTDAHFHRHSVTRQLVRRSTAPVLVVPASRSVHAAPAGRLQVC